MKVQTSFKYFLVWVCDVYSLSKPNCVRWVKLYEVCLQFTKYEVCSTEWISDAVIIWCRKPNKHKIYLLNIQSVCMISGQFVNSQICSLLCNLHFLIVCFLLLSGSDPLNISSMSKKKHLIGPRNNIFCILIIEIQTFVIEMFQVVQNIWCFSNKKHIPHLYTSHSTLYIWFLGAFQRQSPNKSSFISVSGWIISPL